MANTNLKFIEEISRIKEPEIFLGVAKILSVPLIDDNGKERSFEDICIDVIQAYKDLNRDRKRNLLNLLKKANKCKDGVVDADRTENTKESDSDQDV